uniref:Uncharacterized protein n=1 Tax=Coturnix japonica TaxID=93934 RepID=A0A8C2TSV3_COTJA
CAEAEHSFRAAQGEYTLAAMADKMLSIGIKAELPRKKKANLYDEQRVRKVEQITRHTDVRVQSSSKLSGIHSSTQTVKRALAVMCVCTWLRAIGSTHYRCEQQPILFFSISAINNQLVFGSCNKAAGGKQILSTALYPEWSTAALQYLLDGTTGTCTRCGHRNRKPADRLADKHKHFQV